MKTTMQNQTISARTPEPNEKHRVGNVSSSIKREQTRPTISLEKRRINRALTISEVVDLLRDEAPEFFAIAEVVGNWVWVSFEKPQPSEVTAALSELGFHWNSRRKVWQHPCGTESVHPKDRYSTYPVADRQS